MFDYTTRKTKDSVACAVFKIDLKGRFVYIDDETEELLGFPREELFGKSIYEFISKSNHGVLDAILSNHNRYEPFYEALSLTILVNGARHVKNVNAVITINFISGNPVNYQFILMPGQSAPPTHRFNYERRFLELINHTRDEIDFHDVAEIFCRVGDYDQAICYLIDDRNKPNAVGCYPRRELDRTIPRHVKKMLEKYGDGLSSFPEDAASGGNSDPGDSPAVLFLPYRADRRVMVCLHGQAGHYLTTLQQHAIRFLIKTWNLHFASKRAETSLAERLSFSGQMADALNTGIVVVDKGYKVIFANDYFWKSIVPQHSDGATDDFKKLYRGLKLGNRQGKPLPFSQSPFVKRIRSDQTISKILKSIASGDQVSVTVSQLSENGEKLYLFGFKIYHAEELKKKAADDSFKKLILSVIHDIRAPLITIEAFAKRLQSTHSQQLSTDGKFAVNCIVENAKLLQNMINGLGKLSRNWAAEDSAEEVSLRAMLDDILSYLRAIYPHNNYQIKIKGKLPRITAAKQKLTQLFRNILDNAFKYSAASKTPIIEISYWREDKWHRFSISDSGPGVNGDYRQKIFDPFFRAPEFTTTSGTGMGLAIAGDIIRSWGGKIWLDSDTEHGARISFTIPFEIGS